jgi:hypothetical protein
MLHQDLKAAAEDPLSCLYIGRNHDGEWVVRDARSRCGGLFTDRVAAIRFAMYECQRRPQSVIMRPEGLELDGPLNGEWKHRP